MATDTLTTRLNATGGRGTRRELDKTAESARNIGTSAKAANKDVGVLSRGLTLLGTRMGMIIILGGLMAVTLGPGLVASVVLLTGALAALGGVAFGIFGVGAAVALRWKETVDSAGSAASDLKATFEGVRKAFAMVTAVGADKIMRAAADALARLVPVIQTLAPALDALATSIASGIRLAGQDLASLAPMLVTLFTAAGPLIEQVAGLIGPLAYSLILLGTAGIPVLAQLLDWVSQFVRWLVPAIQTVISWEQETHTLWQVLQTSGAVIAWLAGVIADLASIFYQLYIQTQDVWAFVGGALLTAFQALGKGIDDVSKNMDLWGPIVLAVTAALGGLWAAVKLYTLLEKMLALLKLARGIYIGWRAGVLAVTLAQFGLNLQLMITIGIVGLAVIAIAALVVGVIYAYKHFGWFRDSVNWVWQALKDTFNWVKDNWPLLLAILAGPIGLAVYEIATHFDAIKAAFQSVLDWIMPKIQWLIDKFKEIGSGLDKIKGPSGIDIGKKILGAKADGGPIGRSGSYLVGERGPEVVHLPQGANVQPNGAGGDVVVHATLVMPNGDVLARQTLRSARRKQSVS